MQLKCGNYAFDPNSTLLTGEVETLWNAGGQPYAQKRSLHVQGYINVNGQDDAIQKVSALATALAVPFQDIIFFADDGTPTELRLQNIGSITGVHVRDLKFPETKGPEYVSIRSFEFRAEAEYPLQGSSILLLLFKETLTFWGGGPIYKHRMAINGPPQKQLVYPQSVYYATQTGELTGYITARLPPGPIWPSALMHAPRKTDAAPERRSFGNYSGEKITWQYDFESAAPLVARPNFWIK
jgi:hypothetical protein